jgi:hypothetical protein
VVRNYVTLVIGVLLTCILWNPADCNAVDIDVVYVGYLFAHMTKDDYGRSYYSISEDGMHWRLLNDDKRVAPEYRGHPDIIKGHDGRYYLLGNHPDKPDIRVQVSDWH